MIFFMWNHLNPLKKTFYQMNVHIDEKDEKLINYEGIVIKPTNKL
jgi:hypothetical protein